MEGGACGRERSVVGFVGACAPSVMAKVIPLPGLRGPGCEGVGYFDKLSRDPTALWA